MARRLDPTLRERLLVAATEAFAEQGFGGATMTAVGERAGVTKGGVYFHFRSKEQLFFAALDHWRHRLRGAVPGPDDALDGAADLRRAVAAYLGFHFAEPAAGRLLRVLAVELRDRFTAALRGDARQEHAWLRARLRDSFARGHRDGSLFAGDPVFAALLVAGAVHGVLEQWLAAPQDVEPFCDPDALAEALVRPFATGAAGPAERAPRAPAAPPDFQPF